MDTMQCKGKQSMIDLLKENLKHFEEYKDCIIKVWRNNNVIINLVIGIKQESEFRIQNSEYSTHKGIEF